MNKTAKILVSVLCVALVAALALAFVCNKRATDANAAYESAQSAADTLQTQYAAALARADDLQAQLDEGDAANAALQTQLDEANAQIDDLQAQLSETQAALDEANAQTAFDEAEETPAETDVPALNEFADTDIVATVDGEDVPYSELAKVYDYYASAYAAYFDTSDPAVVSMLREEALNGVVQDRILRREAEKLGLYPFSEERLAELKAQADADYNETLEYYKEYFRTEDATEEQVLADTQEYLAGYDYSAESTYENALSNAIYDAVYNYIAQDVAPTDEDIEAAYNENVASAQASYAEDPTLFDDACMSGEIIYYVPEGYRSVKHILVGMDSDVVSELLTLRETIAGDDAVAAAEAQTRYDELMKDVAPKLKEIQDKIAAGENFNALIAEYGEDPGMEEGSEYADKGYYIAAVTTSFDEAFAKASMALEKVGDVSEPVLGSYGWHIIRYESDVPAGPVAFAELRDAFTAEYTDARKQEAYDAAMEKWTTDTAVVPVEGLY